MREVQFRKPNFRAKIREKVRPTAEPVPRLLYAADEPLARAYLDSLGFEVVDIEPYDFQTWIDKATLLRTEVIDAYPKARAAGKRYEFNGDLWSQLKEHLQDLFHGRCGYCEAQFQAVSFGDVEHYRPKAAVTDDPKHPGYYWLAYEPENYLPSCSQCNTGRKRNYFPVSGQRALKPGEDLSREQPLLLNPYYDRYCDHIAYVATNHAVHPPPMYGMPIGRTERGKASIIGYGLDRPWLVRKRVEAQKSAIVAIQQALLMRNRTGIDQILKACLQGELEFCTAVATEIDAYYREMNIGKPFPADIPLGI